LRIAFENLTGVPEFIDFVLLSNRDLAHLLMQKVDKVTFFRGGNGQRRKQIPEQGNLGG